MEAMKKKLDIRKVDHALLLLFMPSWRKNVSAAVLSTSFALAPVTLQKLRKNKPACCEYFTASKTVNSIYIRKDSSREQFKAKAYVMLQSIWIFYLPLSLWRVQKESRKTYLLTWAVWVVSHKVGDRSSNSTHKTFLV